MCDLDILTQGDHFSVCVCVCVCERERESTHCQTGLQYEE